MKEPPAWQQGIQKELRPGLPLTAHHESGHAVVGHFCGFKIRSVTIRPRAVTEAEGSLLASPGYNHHQFFAAGDTDIDYSPALIDGNPRDEDSLKRWVMCVLAGGLAELKASPGGIPSIHARYDLASVASVTVAILGRERADLWAKAVCEETKILLRRRAMWSKVRACAKLLLEKGTINNQEFELTCA